MERANGFGNAPVGLTTPHWQQLTVATTTSYFQSLGWAEGETSRNREHHNTTTHTPRGVAEIWCLRNSLIKWRIRQDSNLQPSDPKLHQPCCRVCACVSASQRRKPVCKSFREIWNVPQRRDTRRKEENHHTTIHTTRSDRIPHAKTSNYE